VAWSRHADGSLPSILPYLPVILGGAAINSVSEEFLFRNSTLPLLRPVMGTWAAVCLTSLRFGLGHLTGNPVGLPGMALTTLLGMVAAWSMIQTRGSGWAWPLHFAADLAVFTAVAMTTSTVYQP
jgi:membrane protease YdiL (CAAX protease family)